MDRRDFARTVIGRAGLAGLAATSPQAATSQDKDLPYRVLPDLEVRRYFSFMLGYPQLDYIVAWGLVGHHSWLQTRNMREDGALKRPTLYDPNYQPKAMRQAIADALKSAPAGG